MKSSAVFSTCREYRWRLNRYISDSKKELIFIGLNPSLANSFHDDPTLRRLVAFAGNWGYGSLIVVNLFARISKSPKSLKTCNDPIGWNNDLELDKIINYWSKQELCDLWIGWGVNGKFMNRDVRLLRKIRNSSKKPLVIGLTKDGHPKHPLYISKLKTLCNFND